MAAGRGNPDGRGMTTSLGGLMTKFDTRAGGVLAVVAVLAAVTLGACAAPADEPARAVLAGSETSGEASPTPTQTDPQTDPQIGPAPEGETPSGGEPWDDAATAACAGRVADSFSQVAQTADDLGVTSFWVAGDEWVACDVVAGEEPVLIASAGAPAGFDERSLELTRTVLTGTDDPAVRFVAAGRLPWPVAELSYAFPDGHTEPARFVTGKGAAGEAWWVVAHTATEGVLADPGTDPADLGPVTVSVVGEAAEAFRFRWEDLQRSE